MVPLLGAIVGCHCSVLWETLREWTWHCWVPLQGAIVVCYGWGGVTTNFGGVDVPLQGAHGTLHSNGIQKKHPEKLP